jgi:dUTP pyrophosphatase
MKIAIQNSSTNEIPAYATEGAAGLDVRANLTESVTLQPLERRLIPTGLRVAIPMGYEIQVRPRSGLAFKHGITVLNTPPFVVEHGERIAQLVVAKHEQAEWEVVNELNETTRGAGGFGSTGVQ